MADAGNEDEIEPTPGWDGDIEPPSEQDSMPEKVAALGYDHGRFYYFATGTRQVTVLSAPEHTRSHLTSIASEAYWYRNYRHHCGDTGSLSWPRVASDLMAACRNAGIYDPERVRGRGAWRDGKRVVVHLGDRLVVDGVAAPLDLPGSRHVYEIGLPLLPGEGLPTPLAASEAVWLEKIARALRWEHKSAGRLFSGWLALAPICAALDWRPSIWLTGPSGAGKSWLASNIVRKILGKFSLFVELSTTEPGLRRLLQADALPVIFDEAEKDNAAAAERMSALMGLVRQASTNSDAVVAKADARGGVDIFRVKSMFCWQSINTAMVSQADISRTEVLELRQDTRPGDVAFSDLKMFIHEHMPDDFGPRLISRSISLIPVIRANAELFSDAIAAIPGQTRRRADQLGALLAGAYSLHSSRILTLAEAEKFAAEDQWVAHTAPAPENRDEAQLLSTLMAHVVRIHPHEWQISRLVEFVLDAHPDAPVSARTACDMLLTVGIKFVAYNGQDGFAISTTHPRLKTILARTAWSSSWSRSLARIEGVLPSSALPPQRFGAALTSRAVWIPASLLRR